MKKGDRIVAKDGCTISLTPGKEYVIEMVNEEGIGIIDDRGREHLFYHKDISKHFQI